MDHVRVARGRIRHLMEVSSGEVKYLCFVLLCKYVS
ncbi:hypothetical protein SLEP1_g57441 [Rubroshorea leprosula]|uniref:Uncharacterized protein n=1 Tax=Rubroshorea leprosula TaxID=152421 RepID=A0AAV5MMX6_9ROSI|nr:hypothetical protein SLEP1_g57441 [Rubroshorea leprosula]